MLTPDPHIRVDHFCLSTRGHAAVLVHGLDLHAAAHAHREDVCTQWEQRNELTPIDAAVLHQLSHGTLSLSELTATDTTNAHEESGLVQVLSRLVALGLAQVVGPDDSPPGPPTVALMRTELHAAEESLARGLRLAEPTTRPRPAAPESLTRLAFTDRFNGIHPMKTGINRLDSARRSLAQLTREQSRPPVGEHLQDLARWENDGGC